MTDFAEDNEKGDSAEEKARKNWSRYVYVRAKGHEDYIQTANLNEKFAFKNEQWSQESLDALGKRPALQLNMIFQILEQMVGQQIKTRVDMGFKPKSNAIQKTAEVLCKLARQTCDDRRYHQHESDAFLTGMALQRAFIDMRLDYSDNINGEPKFETLDPRQVIPDPDASEYDPDSWGDVTTTRLYSHNTIAEMWGEKKAKKIKGSLNSNSRDPGDSIDPMEGFRYNAFGGDAVRPQDHVDSVKHIGKGDKLYRIVERQYWVRGEYPFFIYPQGDMRIVPVDMDPDYAQFKADRDGLTIQKLHGKRVKWTVSSNTCLLYDDWSPYRHFTVIPYYPYFYRGITRGLVDYLISPQELLNKVVSQILHVVNTTANSGWLLPRDSVTNKTPEEIEAHGADTGLVLEYDGDKPPPTKIHPNPIPSGLADLRAFALDIINKISGVSDQARGFRQGDESGVTVKLLQDRMGVGMTRAITNLDQTRNIVARNMLHLFQDHYTSERVVMITRNRGHSRASQEDIELVLNQVHTNEAGEEEVLNDLTVGEYGVKITSTPSFDTSRERNFEELTAMRNLGVQIPDTAMIEASSIPDKEQLLETMSGAKQGEDSPQNQLAQMSAKIDMNKKEADTGMVLAQTREKEMATKEKAVSIAEKIADDPALADIADTIEQDDVIDEAAIPEPAVAEPQING